MRCYLETTEEEFITKYDNKIVPLVDQKIHRRDMAFIIDDEILDSMFFNPGSPVSKNARLFLEDFDDYSKLVCCSEIFNDYGCEIIQNEYKMNK